MSCVTPTYKGGITNDPSMLKKIGKNEIMNKKLPIEQFGKEKIRKKILEMEESFEKSEISESSSCSCGTKEKPPFNYTLHELEQKRLELVRLQRTMQDLRLLTLQQRKAGAKVLKLSLKSKSEIGNPDIKINVETLKKIKYENELVNAEIQHAIKNNVKKNWPGDYVPEEEIDLLKIFNESVYKIFIGRVGHLNGLNQAVFVVLSSEAFCVVENYLCPAVRHRILYEDIETVIVGESERWLSVIERNRTDSKACPPIEFGDPLASKSLLKYLEVALRRRLVTLWELHGGLPLHSKGGTAVTRSLHSIGRSLEPFLPSVVSCSSQELNHIEGWLMEQLKTQRRPRVLACWLVFWESGNEFWCEEDARADPGPRLEGFLMVSRTPRHNRWTPSYFYLKDEMLYQFADPRDRLPQFVIKVQDFCGCRHLPSSLRPHSFELLGKEDGTTLAFAAANADVASQWVQSLLGILGVGPAQPREESRQRRLRPCQVIQTNECLILSRQTGHGEDLYRLAPVVSKGRDEPARHILDLGPSPAPMLEREVECKDKFRRISVRGWDRGWMTSTRGPPSSVPAHVEDSKCPPTPPPPEVGKTQSETDGVSREVPQMGLQLLTFCSLDQIAEVFVTTRPSNGCFMELECSEASEVAGAGGDWALYFESEKRLAHFLASVLATREHMTQELMGLARVSRGRVHDLLIEGSSISSSLWRPQK